MSTRPDTIEALRDVMSDLAGLSFRKMFGEYALYLDAKVVALVCDDTLFVKPTPGALALIGAPQMAPPYPGAKAHIRLETALDEPDLAMAALRAVAADLPAPKPKTRKPKV
ncbi:competence protein TfoX [bacterium]|nr:competence protein TfoX [bacterium]